VESSCEFGIEPTGLTSSGLSSSVQLHRVSYFSMITKHIQRFYDKIF
jgi:hypothetical protein